MDKDGRLFDFFGGGDRSPILQAEAAECGLACIANIAAHYGYRTSMHALRRKFPLSLKGMSLSTILRIASDLGLQGRALRIEVESLDQVRTPALLHWQMNHFLVLRRVSGVGARCRYHVTDPASGNRVVGHAEMVKAFTGVVAEFEPVRELGPGQAAPRLRLNDLWSRSRGLLRSISQIALVTIFSQTMLLVVPLYMQIAFDVVVPSHDLPLLYELGAGFLLLALLAGAMTWFRGGLVSGLGQLASYQLTINLTRHVFKLPQAWFDRRTTADVLSRLSSVMPISDFVSRQAFSMIVSLCTCILYLGVLTLYSGLYLGNVLFFAAVYGGMRIALVRILNIRNAAALQAQARESGMMIENIEGIGAIKAFGVEDERLALWTGRKASAVSTALASARIQNVMDALPQAVTACETIAFTILAAMEAIHGRMSVGMTLAAAIYQQQAMSAGVTFFDTLAAYNGLRVHLERIADIALEEAPVEEEASWDDGVAVGKVEFRDVSFRYGVGEPLVLDGVSFTAQVGEAVAIAGRSGGGKSTILKLMLGLMQPTSGTILVDGKDLQRFGLQRWRRQIGYVAQDDKLFEGSLADNIAFFDPNVDMGRVVEAAEAAAIHEDVMVMPMRYETLVGDMGSSLSGGQKARILIARALYREPRLLVIDEGSAHLDLETEKRLNGALASLGITRIMAAHRPDTLRLAERLLFLEGGKLTELSDRELEAGKSN